MSEASLQFDFVSTFGQSMMVRGRDGPFQREQLSLHSFQMQLLYDIPHLLRMQCDELDEFVTMYFIHSGKRMLSQVLRVRPMRHADMLQFFMTLKLTLQTANSYMLYAEQILLEPDHIYVDDKTGQYCFVHLPLVQHQQLTQGEKVHACCQRLRPFISEETRPLLQRASELSLRIPFIWSEFFENFERDDVIADMADVADAAAPPHERTVTRQSGRIQRFFQFFSMKKNIKPDIEFVERSLPTPPPIVDPLPLPVPEQMYHRTVMLSKQQNGVCTVYPTMINRETNEQTVVDRWPYVLGRDEQSAQLVLPMPSVSRLHAEVIFENECFYIRDLGSRNGTSLNGVKLVSYKVHPLNDGDVITLGSYSFLFAEVGER